MDEVTLSLAESRALLAALSLAALLLVDTLLSESCILVMLLLDLAELLGMLLVLDSAEWTPASRNRRDESCSVKG